MKSTTATKAFVLVAPLYNMPVGEPGQLKQLDSHHVALLFDNHEDLVLDVNDTDPEVWAAIGKPKRSLAHLACAAVILIAFTAGVLWDPL